MERRTQRGEGLLVQAAAAERQTSHLSHREGGDQRVDHAPRGLIGRHVELRQRRQPGQHLDWEEVSHVTPADASGGLNAQWRELTEGVEVGARQAAQVEVQALQVCQVSQVRREALQASRQTFVTGQVQLSQRGEAAKSSTCRTAEGGTATEPVHLCPPLPVLLCSFKVSHHMLPDYMANTGQVKV